MIDPAITSAFLRGAGLMLSMIVAIGAQNIFVISQGLAKSYIFVVCALCTLLDIVFTGFGVFVVGESFAKNELLTLILGVSGILFLLSYAIASFRSAYKGSHFAKIKNAKNASLLPVVLKTLAVTVLNPHVYLDTIVVIGSTSAPVPSELKIWFFCGAVLVSFAWFFSLGYAARALAGLFANEKAWRIIDSVVGVIMVYMAYLIAEFLFKI
ncbi:LysE/ArgO family amino acid transporter [Campylobacter sp. VBCF_05 NA6]|uniref:LysE/ArgO family amino acid transporter n=1 Tax=unclassified Campylobacter TaxID=2593542 RepID=UPI0022E9E19C|nr:MULTISPECIES: LysE/ArgO family amino acid transporter [unclassified Campylobacter]MDA3057393.1 LysE/ArgO family amino acid transporter [Campylobacter sp. VBCF_04 NA7]MDA3059035.1 LysE/ArgO family amino acid transporter [Campylobacter sp. VBCF_05 NA6]